MNVIILCVPLVYITVLLLKFSEFIEKKNEPNKMIKTK